MDYGCKGFETQTEFVTQISNSLLLLIALLECCKSAATQRMNVNKLGHTTGLCNSYKGNEEGMVHYYAN